MDDGVNTNEQGATPPTELVKKAYEKPDIIYHAPLEAMAADCSGFGKADGVCGISFS